MATTPGEVSEELPPVDVWIHKLDFKSTAEVKIPERLVDQVIGQERAVEVIRKAAEQKRHVMLIGDPGTGKSELLSYMSRLSPRGIYATGKAASAAGLCVAADSLVVTSEGVRTIENLSQPYFRDSARARSMETAAAQGAVATVDDRHRSALKPLETVWRLKPPAAMLEIEMASGLSLSVTPATRVLVDHAMGQSWIQAKFVRPGMHVAAANRLEFPEQPALPILAFLRKITTRVVVDVDQGLVDEIIAGLKSKFGTLREAAARLLLAETSLYDAWRNGKHDIPLAQLLVAARAAHQYFGSTGLFVAAGLAGLTDVDAITISTARLARDGVLASSTANAAILLASAANTVVKGGLAVSLGGKALRSAVLPIFLTMVLLTIAACVFVAWH